MHPLPALQQAQARLGTGFGFAVVIIGTLCLFAPFMSGIAINSLLAVAVAAAGITMTVYAFKAGKFGKGLLQFLFGGITLIAGLVLFVHPILGVMSLTVVLIAWFFVDGIFGLIAGFKAEGGAGRGWILASGVASIVLGVLLAMDWPGSGVYAVGMLVGVRLIFSGWTIAMLGMAGDAAADAIDKGIDSAEEAISEAVEARAGSQSDSTGGVDKSSSATAS